MATENMSGGEQGSGKDTSPSMNTKPLTNAATSSKKQRSLSKIIQNFKNLFYQELFDINNINKIFIV